MSNLPDLPPSNHRFWDMADKHSKVEEFKKCDHFFERKGMTVECKRCHIGSILTPPFYLLEGKICLGDEAVI